jgi:hypothetical protein
MKLWIYFVIGYFVIFYGVLALMYIGKRADLNMRKQKKEREDE